MSTLGDISAIARAEHRQSLLNVSARRMHMPKTTPSTEDKPWYEKHPVFKNALFHCPSCDTNYDPPPTPAICECGEDLVVAVQPQEIPTQKTVKVCVQCGTESQKMSVELQGGKNVMICPVCGSTGGVLETTVPLSEAETAVLTARNDERARVRAAAENAATTKAGA